MPIERRLIVGPGSGGGGGEGGVPDDGSVTNAKVADDAGIAQSKIAGLVDALTLVGHRLDSFDGISDVGDVGSSLTVTPGLGNGGIKLITLTAPDCELSFNDGLPGRLNSIELVITQDATGGRTITWNETIKWQGGLEPILSTEPNAVDRLILTSYDGGATWFGDVIGLAYA